MATLVTITGTLKKPDGTAEAGTIHFQPTHALFDSSGDLIVSRAVKSVTLTAAGAIPAGTQLYATTDLQPANVQYRCTMNLTTRKETFVFSLPAAPSTQDIADLIPATSELPATYRYALAADLADHLADSSGAHAAAAISVTPTGGLAATDVQAALAELDSEKQALVPFGRSKQGGTTYLSVPGFVVASATTLTLSAGVRYFWRLFVGTSLQVDQLLFEVTTAAAGNARIGLASADEDWQPAAILTDSGDISTGTTGVKTFTPGSPLLLPPGRYLGVLHASAAAAIRVLTGGLATADLLTTLGSAPVIARRSVPLTYGPLDTTPWTAVASGGAEHAGVMLRISDPTP
jgi:hypothetical protein